MPGGREPLSVVPKPLSRVCTRAGHRVKAASPRAEAASPRAEAVVGPVNPPQSLPAADFSPHAAGFFPHAVDFFSHRVGIFSHTVRLEPHTEEFFSHAVDLPVAPGGRRPPGGGFSPDSGRRRRNIGARSRYRRVMLAAASRKTRSSNTSPAYGLKLPTPTTGSACSTRLLASGPSRTPPTSGRASASVRAWGHTPRHLNALSIAEPSLTAIPAVGTLTSGMMIPLSPISRTRHTIRPSFRRASICPATALPPRLRIIKIVIDVFAPISP